MRTAIFGLLASLLLVGAAPPAPPDLTLTGVLTRADHERYREVPFTVPAGVDRVTVELDYEGRDVRTVVDLGLRDPDRFRGWSGGNKRRISVGEASATPSYLPGPIPPGEWRVILGVPNIRAGSRSSYTVRVWLERGDAGPLVEAPLKAGPGWYRGDLHTHTGHSDGACAPAGGGERVPCPVHRTLDAAKAAGLDFVAVTDHNTVSQANSLRELAPSYPGLLAIVGREVTTFQGHFNAIGPSGPLPFQVHGRTTMAEVLGAARAAGALTVVNHPALPSGEACMGCGWTAAGVDWSQVDAVEVINGGTLRAEQGQAETALSGIGFWQARLNAGARLTAVAASDNHDAGLPPDAPSAVGRPRTVVYARELSQAAVLEGLRSGRAFVDLTGDPDVVLDLTAQAGGASAVMGGVLTAASGAAVTVEARLSGLNSRVAFVADGRPLGPAEAPDADGVRRVVLQGRPRWVRAEVRDETGRLLLLSNPIYVN